MEENMIVIRDLKTFCFNFDVQKDVDENLKHGIKFIVKSKGALAEHKINKKRD